MKSVTGTRICIRAVARFWLLELAAPFPVVAGGQLQPAVAHRGLQRGFGVFDHAHFVAVARVHGDVADEQAALAFDLLRAEHALDRDDLRERHLRAGARGHEDLFQLGNVFAKLAQVAHADRVALAAFDGLHEVHAADGDLDHVLHVADVHAVTRDAVAVDFKLQIRLPDDAVGDDVGRAGDLL